MEHDIDLVIAWYDFWIGLYYNKNKKCLYIFPFPCIGFLIKFGKRNLRDKTISTNAAIVITALVTVVMNIFLLIISI